MKRVVTMLSVLAVLVLASSAAVQAADDPAQNRSRVQTQFQVMDQNQHAPDLSQQFRDRLRTRQRDQNVPEMGQQIRDQLRAQVRTGAEGPLWDRIREMLRERLRLLTGDCDPSDCLLTRARNRNRGNR